MSIKKIITLCLLLAITLNLLCSCDLLNDFVDTMNSSDNQDEVSGVVIPPEEYCYIITCGSETLTRSATYNFGDEITITLKLQIHPEGYYSISSIFDNVKMSFSIKESPSFEVISEPVITYDSIITKDYICGNEADNYLVADFKIKIKEPEYIANMINISVTYEYFECPDDPALFRTYSGTSELTPVYYITDSQGVIINTTTGDRNHLHRINNTDELMVLSYNREYFNGVKMETLIDRYIECKYGENVFCNYRTLGKKMRISLFRKEYKISHEIIYVSKDLRFKVYIDETPDLNYKFYKTPEFARSALEIALQNKVITQAEYEAEIYRLENTAEYSIDGLWSDNIVTGSNIDLFIYGTVLQEQVNSDAYFNYVLDAREDW